MATKKKTGGKPSAASIKKASKQLKDIKSTQKKLTLAIKNLEKFMCDEFM